MSCPGSTASTEFNAFCLHASRCRRVARVRRGRTQRWHAAPLLSTHNSPLTIRKAFCRTRSASRPSPPRAPLIRRSTSDPPVPFTTAIFPIAAAAAVQIGEALHQLDAHHVFRHLVAGCPEIARFQSSHCVLEVGGGVVAVVEFC